MKLTQLEIQNQVATLSLNRPDVHNAMNAELIAELTQSFKNLAEDASLRVVVLKGEGPSFCAGADLNYMKAAAENTHEQNLAEAACLHKMLDAIYSCPKPVIAQVQGAAVGGGMGLVAAADFVVAELKTKFSFSEVRLGIVPAVISPFVRRKLSFNAARKLFMLASRFSAEEALDLGLVDAISDLALLEAATGKIVSQLLKASPSALTEVKRLCDQIWSQDLESAQEITAQSIAQCRVSADGQEGMAAFFEKRKAKFI